MSFDFESKVLAGRVKGEIFFILADVITGEDYPLAACVVGASTIIAVAAVGGVVYLVRRCRTRNIDHPADEQVG